LDIKCCEDQTICDIIGYNKDKIRKNNYYKAEYDKTHESDGGGIKFGYYLGQQDKWHPFSK